jgi:hypothetical protein
MLTENHGNKEQFRLWLKHEAEMDLGRLYRDEFKREFGPLISENVEQQLYYAAKNLIYMLLAYTDTRPLYEIGELVKMMNSFMTEQMDGFDEDFEVTEWEIGDDPV